jgi:hypothetical protein
MGYEYSMNVFICVNLTKENKDIKIKYLKKKAANLIKNLNKEILILK